ncbi:hypothetical protein VNO77_26733 [Canavalia gladiata]|uniref:Protein FAR1-RELATED SEQUENCE n=1 Tax=Canavalia gladiata TaxID=3824 RepID=A0AAN9Q9W8_CANGL
MGSRNKEIGLSSYDGKSVVKVCVDNNEAVNSEEEEQHYMKNIADLTYDEIWGLEFDSEREVVQFYCLYARVKGFFARKDEIGRDCKGAINMRQIVCNREGSRNKKHNLRMDRLRDPRPLTRTKCGAKFRVHFDHKSQNWKVVSFVDTHNHELTPPDSVHLIPGYRTLNDGDKAQINSFHLHGVQTSHIFGLMVGQKGDHSSLGFCKKDLYNHINRKNRARIEDGDAFAALCYLQAKADNDPMYFLKFTTSTDGRLQHLFWADGCNRVNYECFGDVITFDTTYKKNKYNRPLVIFCGYNHHGETTIFGFALVADESTETYKWVLETFSEAMFGKHPNGVVTDGDHAMREAVRDVFPNTSHRLCAWHIQKNAAENVKNKHFLEEFKHLIYSSMSIDEFEDEWKKIIEKYGLVENKWMRKMYKMKSMWASTYMRDHFFGGIRTTSVCEGINSFIKRYVKNKSSLVDLMHNLERALKQYRHNELNNANNIGSGMKNIMDEDVIPTECSAKVVKGDDRECQAVYIPNPTTIPPPMMKTSFTSLLQNLHNLGKTGDPGHVKESPSGVENIF